MAEPIESVLSRVFGEVLKNQAFLFCDPLPAEDFEPPEPGCLLACIAFGGATRGTLRLIAGAALAREIAANYMGLPADDPAVEADHRDALKEVANVLCGHLLTALAGEGAPHDLSIPDLREISGEEAALLATDPIGLAFQVEDHQALVCLELERGPDGGRREDGL